MTVTYILNDANFNSVIKLRTKVPVFKEAVHWERMLHNFIRTCAFEKRSGLGDHCLLFHEFNRTFFSICGGYRDENKNPKDIFK